MYYLLVKIGDAKISLLLDTGATNFFISAEGVERLGLGQVETKEVTVTFAQGSRSARSMVPNLEFKVGDVKFREDFTVCELNGLDFILGNTFFDFYGVEIRRRPKPSVVMVGKKGKPYSLPYSQLPELDPRINLVTQSELRNEVFIVQLQGVHNM